MGKDGNQGKDGKHILSSVKVHPQPVKKEVSLKQLAFGWTLLWPI
jgi:hypothetical protein